MFNKSEQYSVRSSRKGSPLRIEKSWKERYEEAADKIFTPSKLEEKHVTTNSIHESSDIRNNTKIQKWEKQLRQPFESYN